MLPLLPAGQSVRWIGAVAITAGAVSLLALAEISGELSGRDWSAVVPYTAQVALLFGGLALLVFGFGRPQGQRSEPGWSAGEALSMAALTMGALVIRLWHLDTALPLLIDEGNSIDVLMHIRRPPDFGLVQAPATYFTTLLYPYWNAVTAEAVGRSLLGLRIGSAVLGAATIPALYVLARNVTDRTTATLAAVVLATFPPHVHFSRLALPHIMDQLAGTIALASVACGLTSDRRAHWALAGAALGITHYGFEAGRLFFTPLVAMWLAVTLLTRPSLRHTQRTGMRTMLIVFLLAVFPVYYTAAARGAGLVPRWQASGWHADSQMADAGTVAGALLHNLGIAAQMYGVRSEITAMYYGGDYALILPWLLPFFVGGLLTCVLRWRSGLALMLIWIVAVVAANASLHDPTVTPRWVVSFPAIGLTIAIGLHSAGSVLRPVIGSRWATSAALALGFALAATQAFYYFNIHLPRFEDQARRDRPHRDAFGSVLRVVAQLAPGTDVIFVSEPVIDVHPPRSLLAFLAPDGAGAQLDAYAPNQIDHARLAMLRPERDAAFFVPPHAEEIVARLRRCLELTGPRSSPSSVPPDKGLDLYVSHAPRKAPTCTE